jgi:hypothetical protein
MNCERLLDYLSKQYCIYFHLELNEIKSIQMVIDDQVIRGIWEKSSYLWGGSKWTFSFENYVFDLFLLAQGTSWKYYFRFPIPCGCCNAIYDIHPDCLLLYGYSKSSYCYKKIPIRCKFNCQLEDFSYKKTIIEDIGKFELAMLSYLMTSDEIEDKP